MPTYYIEKEIQATSIKKALEKDRGGQVKRIQEVQEPPKEEPKDIGFKE